MEGSKAQRGTQLGGDVGELRSVIASITKVNIFFGGASVSLGMTKYQRI